MQKHQLSEDFAVAAFAGNRSMHPVSRSCTVSRHYSLVRYSRSVTWKRLTKCPVRDYEIALPPALGVFNLVYYRPRLSFSPHRRSSRARAGQTLPTLFSPVFGQDTRNFSVLRCRLISILIRYELIREKRGRSRKLVRETIFPLVTRVYLSVHIFLIQ